MSERSGINLDASVGYVFYSDYSNLNYLTGQARLDAKYLTSSRFNFYLKNAFIRSDDPRERELFSTAEDNKYLLGTKHSALFTCAMWSNRPWSISSDRRAVSASSTATIITVPKISKAGTASKITSAFSHRLVEQAARLPPDYGYTNGHFEASPDLNGHRVSGAYMLRFTPKATASLKGAYTLQTFSEDLRNYQIYETSAGISYLFSQTLTASAEAGYYWLEPEAGINRDGGVIFKADITQNGERTKYRLSVQGGYVLDYFTSQNLGFRTTLPGDRNHHSFSGQETVHRMPGKNPAVGGRI
ncbi:MAG: hypothetical protein MZV70_19425 [Desulfobacterales bacterium]|nr:hypothetical protein [Desulfobacterales bacterium]